MEIYIEKAFLDTFLKQFDSENDLHRNLKKMFCKASLGTVYLDLNTDDKEAFMLALEENALLEELISSGKSVQTDSLFKETCFNPDFYETGTPSKYFFVDTLDSIELEVSFGCLAFNMENLERASFLFGMMLKHLSKTRKDPNDWAFVKDFKHPFNSLVLTDNYLFDYTDEELKQNLVPLLLGLMPVTLSIQFDITIIGKDTKKNIDIKTKKSVIEEALMLKLPYSIQVTIIPEAVHDRNIFTNYLWLSSGIGFNIFRVAQGKIKLKNDSVLFALPNSYLNLDFGTFYTPSSEANHNLVFRIRNGLLSECKRINKMETMSVGTKQNRLLNLEYGN